MPKSEATPQKILFIIDQFSSPFAGTEGQLTKLISGLDTDEFTPELLLFKPSKFIEENGFPCKVAVLHAYKLSSPLTWFKLFSFLFKKKREGVGLAHIFFNDPSIIAPPLLKFLGIKSIISRRDMGYWYTQGYLKVLRFNSKLVDAVIVNSEAVKTITCKQEGYAPEQVKVIYNGYEDKNPNQREQDDCTAQIVLRKTPDELVLGIVANIRPIKRMEDAIKALAVLTQKGHALRLVIVGGGDASELYSLAENLNVREKLDCVGSQDNTGDYIQAFDIALLCSESEGFSNAIIEYMQHAKPVVCSAVGGNPEAIDQGVTGYCYPMGDVNALKEHIEVFVDNASLRESLGQAGQEKVVNHYSMNVMLSQHEEFYKNLLN